MTPELKKKFDEAVEEAHDCMHYPECSGDDSDWSILEAFIEEHFVEKNNAGIHAALKRGCDEYDKKLEDWSLSPEEFKATAEKWSGVSDVVKGEVKKETPSEDGAK